ncbi:MAG: hypothetical protein K0R71_1060 [Bacillales bacterium]|jgi:uncharacterized protein YhfF|nr:hypothetical protein [Bacillales bacterium]
MDTNQLADQYWAEFLKCTSKDETLEYDVAYCFGENESQAGQILNLILEEKKTATSSSYLAFQVAGEPLPRKGEFEIITDWDGNPGCIVEIVDVKIIPFKDIKWEIAKLEGEEESMQAWRVNRTREFTEEGAEIGYSFNEEMPVVFVGFRVVFK